MPSEHAEAEARGPADPTTLRYVGPATAAVIEAAPYDAAAVRAGRVSYRELVDAGVNPGVAERLRREYGLVWAYRWHFGGEDLPLRAAHLRGAGEGERRWIAASAPGWDGELPGYDGLADERSPEPPPDLDALDWPDWPEPTGEDPGPAGLAAALDDARATEATCPRCDADLTRYSLDGRESVHCEACGYAGVAVAHGGEDAWRKAVERVVRGR